MATKTHEESRRMYSWWWDSHIPKNSKWLQENLTDMDSKVKAMIKLIEEDADSFARRAEMYYKKRPELMKLVEEFYRAYRALAERYDHATGALRQAHRTMAEAFPNQVPFMLPDDSPSSSSAAEAEPHTPETLHPLHGLVDPDDLHKDALGLSSSHLHALSRNGTHTDESESITSKRGLKQLNDQFELGEGVQHHANVSEGKVRKGLNFHEEEARQAHITPDSAHAAKAETEIQTLKEAFAKLETEKEAGLLQYRQSLQQLTNLEIEISRAQDDARGLDERALKAETEVQTLKQTLAKLEAEKEAGLVQYQQSLERLSNLETDFSHAQEGARELNERAGKAETEVETLKQSLAKLEAEKEASLLQYNQCLERISNLEAKVSRAEEEAGGHDERATKAESEAKTLKQALTKLEDEKEAGLLQYKQCLETISDLESKLSHAKEEAERLSKRADKAESEVELLKQDIAKMIEEKEATALQYQSCLETISDLEAEISSAQEERKRLESEIAAAGARLISAQEKHLLMEKENQSLQSKLEALVQKTEVQKVELSGKQEEVEKLHKCIEEESLRFMQAEATVKVLQNMHAQSQQEQRGLTMELQKGILMLKDMEHWNHGLEEELQQVTEENKKLNEQNISSSVSINNLQDEIFRLKELIAKLEEDVGLRLDQRNALQQEIYCLKEEINGLNKRHRGVIKQVESVGLTPDSLRSSVMDLRDENSKLKENLQKENDQKVTLLQKLENMEKLLERNALLENSLSDVNVELEGLREKVKELEESCKSFQQEISTLDTEKGALVSQLEIATATIEKLTEKNTLLENSICDTNVELEGLREKSKCLQESCQSLDHERSDLLTERDTLVSHLKKFQQTLDELEKKYTELEEKYTGLEKEKETTIHHVEELRASLNLEKEEHATFVESSEIRLTHLEDQVRILQDEGSWRKKEFDEEQDKALKAQVEIFILQRCILDMEEKNFSLLIECQKYFEQSKLAEKMISQLEEEFFAKQAEAKSLTNQIENVRSGIQQVLKSLKLHPDYECQEKMTEDQLLLEHIAQKIEDAVTSLLKTQDEKQQLLFETSILVTLLEQLRMEMSDLESERSTLHQELNICMEELLMVQNAKQELLQMNGQLTLEMRAGVNREEELKEEMENLLKKLANLQEMYNVIQNENYKLHEGNRALMKKFSELEEEKCMLEEENTLTRGEVFALGNVCLVLKSFGAEKTVELEGLAEDFDHLCGVNSGLEMQVAKMGIKVEMVETENLHLKKSVGELETELSTARNANDQLNHEFGIRSEMLIQKEMELSKALEKFEASQNENVVLSRDVEDLKREYDESKLTRVELEKQILELSEDNTHQREEIGCLHEANWRLESEVAKLHDEIEAGKIREECSSSELLKKINEVEVQETEAVKQYGNLQCSNICAALFEKKGHELIQACGSLEEENAAKVSQIDQLKERLHVLEGENGGLKSKLVAYSPIIVSLRESLMSLEDHVLSRTKILGAYTKEEEGPGIASNPPGNSGLPSEDEKLMTADDVSDLQELQSRVEAVEKAVIDMERLAVQESMVTNIKLQAAMKEIEVLKSANSSIRVGEVQTSSDIVLQLEKGKMAAEPRNSKGRNGLVMKDIPLDQVSESSYDAFGSHVMSRRENSETDEMLELWETSDKGSNDMQVNKLGKMVLEDTSYNQIEAVEECKSEYPSSELQIEKELGVDKLEISKTVTETTQGNKRKILERLASDAQKLTNLQITVQDLKNKMETSTKSKKTKGTEYDTLKGQLQEVEEAVLQLFDVNGKLTKNAEGSRSPSDGKAAEEIKEAGKSRRRRISEQARKGSEKIGRLQLELQRIQFVLLKLDDENAAKEANAAKRSTRVLLRDYIYSGGKGNRRKKACCACVRPATKGD